LQKGEKEFCKNSIKVQAQKRRDNLTGCRCTEYGKFIVTFYMPNLQTKKHHDKT